MIITFARKTVKFKPGEKRPEPNRFEWSCAPGYRWETDAEFRARILEALEEGKEDG